MSKLIYIFSLAPSSIVTHIKHATSNTYVFGLVGKDSFALTSAFVAFLKILFSPEEKGQIFYQFIYYQGHFHTINEELMCC